MASPHPYTTSQGGLAQTITQFRQSFPATVDASTLKKLGFAPNNESYILNVFRFLGLITEDGKKSDLAAKTFNLHEQKGFAEAFGALVRAAYKDLFDIRADAAWNLDIDALIAFFRANDGTSAIVGRRQATTFQLLAAFSGHGDIPEARQPTSAGGSRAKTAKPKSKQQRDPEPKQVTQPTPPPADGVAQVGLTVRVEINLPADGDQATYDRIFKSIRENLLSG